MYILRTKTNKFLKFTDDVIVSLVNDFKEASFYNTIGEAMKSSVSVQPDIISTAVYVNNPQ